MANINEVYGSGKAFLKAADIPDEGIRLTMRLIRIEKLKNQEGVEETKPVIEFDEIEQAMVVNKTNATSIVEYYGPETDDWIGKPIDLIVQWVDFGGKSVEAIRVRKQRKRTGATLAAPAAAKAPAAGDARAAMARTAPAAVNEDAEELDPPF
jgi:hypothetical protein